MPHKIPHLMECAKIAASMSPDPSTKVGAAMLLSDDTVAMGWNHLPYGTPEDWINDRELKYANIVHAEEHLLLQVGREAADSILVVTCFPCQRCARLIIDAKVRRVVALQNLDYEERWAASVSATMEMFSRASVEWEIMR